MAFLLTQARGDPPKREAPGAPASATEGGIVEAAGKQLHRGQFHTDRPVASLHDEGALVGWVSLAAAAALLRLSGGAA